MLQQLSLKNFKLFGEQGITITPGKITVLIGANGTGKSSVLQALVLLKQSANGPNLVTSGRFMNIGTFGEIVHDQIETTPIEIDLSVSYQGFSVVEEVQPHLAPSGTFQYKAVVRNGTLEGHTATIGSPGGETLKAWQGTRETGVSPNCFVLPETVRIDLATSNLLGYPIAAKETVLLQPPQAQAQRLERMVSAAERSYQAEDLVRQVPVLLSTILTFFERFHLTPALRGFEYLVYNIMPGKPSSDMMEARDFSGSGNYIANILASDPDLAEEVSQLLNRILLRQGLIRSRLQEGYLVAETKAGSNKVNIFNEAFGLNQLVAPILALIRLPEDSLIAIEEPESHLHPKAQANLCNVFVDIATNEHKQLMLTTHSEHILMSLLTAVAEGKLQPEHLAVYEFQRHGDAALADRLEVNQHGQVAGGLRGFLETDLEEIGDLIAARFAHKI